MSEPRRKICFVTGSRADFGLIIWPMRAVRETPCLSLQLIATGMHLSPEFGYTIDNIRAEGFDVDESVETLLSSDSGVGVAKSVGLGVIGFADAFARLKPDLVVVLGDRYETFAAAQAAMFLRLPMAHLFGGDVTEGAIDEAIRHAITKMAHLHFATNADSARRLTQLGEDPARVFTVGSPGIDSIKRLKLMDRETIGREVGMTLGKRNVLVTFHPVTVEMDRSVGALEELFASLAALDPEFSLFFTLANADAEGRALNERIRTFVAGRTNAIAVASLGQLRYISLMNQADVVVGNSSSGIYEAPSLNVPTVDIGDRQKGRERAASVFHAAPDRASISQAIAQALARGRQPTVSPYGDGETSRRVADKIASIPDFGALLKKGFYDGEAAT
ncbi:UDP-N-acetylglucosamine 2-epimerase [Bradyrhizobium daqingense]|uniref:UDP-N-acetylglucosamine 2-epimerase (Non-hydrolysing)/GDP/UDP-N,N'-diacetylbacillosamine 2-epimerase (Hydrolysing) n=1 Tax=Bradyrhizobium daqingense TaxID=993502 RepID=A0A562LQG8_9BRAD|nr:UDP-N-acetylglucosamine 2-epimerase [Bradyrhizobium daqingense]TWI09881.1 UDP-N-acetylglucosamine 2-epimerase (non-hydrolysing)/GDP/UDP-N,N'-diacetylbacillosamine 2-epimerase (hydrolysing) [Bradyrhizobium daqingense]UFS88197.1 UDP-N-acetylglucosamine 2-epimerase [Bradyrhizobium daqingense]